MFPALFSTFIKLKAITGCKILRRKLINYMCNTFCLNSDPLIFCMYIHVSDQHSAPKTWALPYRPYHVKMLFYTLHKRPLYLYCILHTDNIIPQLYSTLFIIRYCILHTTLYLYCILHTKLYFYCTYSTHYTIPLLYSTHYIIPLLYSISFVMN